MCVIFKLVGVGDYSYKEKAKVKSKEIYNKKFRGATRREKDGQNNYKKRRSFYGV